MNSHFYIEKLEASEEFKQFKKENPDAYLCSGFFVLDKTGKEKDKSHLDYFAPKLKQIFSFQLDEGIKKVPVDAIDKKYVPTKFLGDSEISFEEIEKMIQDEMEKRGIKNKIEKSIIVFQNKAERDFFLCTIFISGFGLLKVYIDAKEKKITEFEKKSFFDMLKFQKGGKK